MADDQRQPEVLGITDVMPQSGESLAAFAARAGLDLENAPEGSVRKWQDPTPEEIKQLIADPATPGPVRLFWQQRRYGRGGAGRRATRQEILQREKVSVGPHRNPEKLMLRGISGRQRKRGRRLWNRMGSVIHQAETS